MSNFKSLNYVPKMLRKLNGAVLTMAQIDEIIDKANADSAGANDFSRSLGLSRVAFIEKHELSAGHWVLKGEV